MVLFICFTHFALFIYFFAVFSFISAVCVWTSVLYNQQHRLLLMNGKINAMHFVIISFAVSRCLSPCFIFPPSLCFTPFPSLPLFTPVSSATSVHLPLEIYSPHLHAFLVLSWTFLPAANPSFPSFNLFKPPLPHLSVLWWGAGWPWIPLLLWGNNRRSLCLCAPLSPTWGPQSTGKEGARETEGKGRRVRERGIEAITA